MSRYVCSYQKKKITYEIKTKKQNNSKKIYFCTKRKEIINFQQNVIYLCESTEKITQEDIVFH